MDIMVDIETLGTEPDAVVLSVGIVHFDRSGPDLSTGRHLHLNIMEQLNRGRSVTAATICWWLQQSDEARAAISTLGSTTIEELWNAFPFKLDGLRPRIWARGTHFDITILAHLHRQFGYAEHWAYNAPRDSRTILDLLPDDLVPKRSGVAHNALDDAIYEAECVSAALRYIDSLKPPAP